jgi:hypothetical protein
VIGELAFVDSALDRRFVVTANNASQSKETPQFADFFDRSETSSNAPPEKFSDEVARCCAELNGAYCLVGFAINASHNIAARARPVTGHARTIS